jgi:hypothetical protein
MVKRFAILASLLLLLVLGSTPVAEADPGPVCGVAGMPPCAGPGDPAIVCAIIAWRTFTPCNYWGVQVPQGTPGSLG